MDKELIFRLMDKELVTLKEFLSVLDEERDAIVSFSLEGIIKANNRKEELLRRIDFLEAERENLLTGVEERDAIKKGDEWQAFSKDFGHTIEEIGQALNKNARLLSFSIDHVRSSIEGIVEFINRANYLKDKGDRKGSISLLLSREA